MKNIHLLPTDKPSRLFKVSGELKLTRNFDFYNGSEYQNIYITSDEEIKEGDWYLNTEEKNGIKNPFYRKLYKANKSISKVPVEYLVNDLKKIILTTDQDLIADGVQAIDDEFLEWFVKNPSCEFVEVADIWKMGIPSTHDSYQLIIPQEEPKQELNSLVESWQKRQKEYESLAEKHRDSEHTYKKYTYRAQATRDCWKELLKLIEDEKRNY
jgi:hypothetical protein